MGGSYGGYMTNWLSVKSADRFACFISQAGIFDLNSFYLTAGNPKFYTDLQIFGYDGDVTKFSDLSKYSPSAYIANAKKPMLITHGGKDTNVPIDQGLAAYTAHQYRNITSKFLYFPNEGHGVLDSANIVVQIDTYLEWFNTHTKA